MADITIDRTGGRPLTFPGKLVAEATSKLDTDPGNLRWHDIAVYRRTGKTTGFVVAIAYHTDWETETDHHCAEACTNDKEVAWLLQSYDPFEWFIGPPKGGYIQNQRRERLMKDLLLRYRDAVSEVLEKFEPERLE
jgi:hypothetical protein